MGWYRDKWFVLAVVALVLAAWMFRFDIREAPPDKPVFAVALDRWTGGVKLIAPGAVIPMGYAWKDE